MNNPWIRRRFLTLAALTTGVCLLPGIGCIQAIASSIGATFF
jgi:hypothetical protein